MLHNIVPYILSLSASDFSIISLPRLLEKCSKTKIILKLYFAFQIINLIQKVNCQHQWNLYMANVTINGFLRQVEQGFSSFFAIFYHSIFGVLNFEKSSNMAQKYG